MSPPRIMFDDGSRIMDDGAPQSSSSNESQQPSSSLTSSSPSSARGALSLERYYEIDRVAKEVVDKLDWSRNTSRGVLLHQIISSTSSTTTTAATTNIATAADNIHCDTIDGATNKPKSNDGTTASIVQDEDGFLCRIALQFPDELLGDGPEVSWLMEVAIVNAYKDKLTTAKSTSSSSSLSSSSSVVVPLEKNLAEQVEQHVAQTPLLFILGDTTYGACCPDEVSANHLNANLIVHYGYACLSPTEAVPVVYAFGVSTVGSCCIPVGSRCVEEEEDATNVNAVWKECVQLVEKETGSTGDQSAMEVDKSLDEAMAQMSTSSSNEEQSKKLLILYEVKYHHAMEELRMEFENTGRFQVVVGSIPKQQLSGSATRRLEGMTKGGGGGCGNGGGSGGGGCGDGGCGSGATLAAPVVPPATENGCCDSINGGAQADQSCATTDNSSCCAKGGENANCNSASDTKDATTPDQRVVIEKQYIPRTIGGLEIPNDLNLSQYALLYIGDDLNIASHEPTAPTRLLHILLRCTSPIDGPPSLLSYSPQHRTLTPNLLDAPLSPTDSTSLSTALSRILRRRYFLLNKTKLATTIAILIGTTSNSYSFRRLLSRTRSRIQSTGRTAYTVSVGKLSSSPSKLTNFAEIDAFVLIACGESVAKFWRMEREEMIVPVLTPLELDVALGYREWDGRYSCDFGDLIRWDEEDGVFVEDGYGDDDGGCDDLVAKEAAKGNDGNGSDDNDDDDDDDSDDEPFFSMISGRYEQSRTASSKHNKTDLQALPGQGKIVEYRSEAAEFLKRREYRGLEANVGETEAKAAVLGQVGIASNYGEKLGDATRME